MNNEQIVDSFNKRKKYMREYAKKRYHNDPSYRLKQKNRQKEVKYTNEYYEKNKDRMKSKRIYNRYNNKYPEDCKILKKENYIQEDLSRNPDRIRQMVGKED